MLEEFDAFIGYTPIDNELDPSSFLEAQKISVEMTRLPTKRAADPFSLAETLTLANTGKRICVLIPGREFDQEGTRHGRGGGWYDRFLSGVPREWLRVGVLRASQLSKKELKREAWDEPMDALLIEEKSTWKFLPIKR